MLSTVQSITIPRCHFRENYLSCQLHIFVDASDSAFAAAAYFRFESASHVKCSLVASKTKVAPVKLLSIPRLELQAAVLGTRLANTIRSAHTITINRSVFWTDSINVMSWLRSDHRKYRQFVAFRVSEILDSTNQADWRWVPSKQNVADDATKFKEPSNTLTERWYAGPEFLQLAEADWPVEVQNKGKVFVTEEEAKSVCSHIHVQLSPLENLIAKCSQWRKAYRTVAWVLRFMNNFNHKRSKINGVLQPSELKAAKSKLYRYAQADVYSEEIVQLQKNPAKPVDKSSDLYQKSPFIDDFGVLRMRGRTERCSLATFEVVNPILLPKKHRVTRLIVQNYHEKYLHGYRETVVNEVKQLYCIPQLRTLLNHISTTCQHCKNLRAKPKPPEMSIHPKAAVAVGARPFSYVGIDYFGPIEVIVGRHVEKRWGCLFVCLTIRAIHIEIAYSLSMDSCMMCIRNFIARRGMPLEIRSDNGTNFIGVRNELQKLIYSIPIDDIKAEFEEINWKLNPPSAPHMGGCWERQVREIKKCLAIKMPTKRPDDENLRCYLMEVENMINSRPLTYMPIHADDSEAMTPNHFLVGSSCGAKPFHEFDDNVLTVKRNYKLSQIMAQHFWQRWLKEFLPTLTRRTKWFEKVKPIEVGDVVVIMDDKRRNSWMKGLVIETIVGRNSDQVRQVVIRTPSGTYTRPATKVAVLDLEPNDGKPKQPFQDVSTYRGENVAAASI